MTGSGNNSNFARIALAASVAVLAMAGAVNEAAAANKGQQNKKQAIDINLGGVVIRIQSIADDGGEAGGARALDDALDVAREIGVREVRVNVEQSHRRWY